MEQNEKISEEEIKASASDDTKKQDGENTDSEHLNWLQRLIKKEEEEGSNGWEGSDGGSAADGGAA